jgi:Domain of Unknown Function (DUF1080)
MLMGKTPVFVSGVAALVLGLGMTLFTGGPAGWAAEKPGKADPPANDKSEGKALFDGKTLDGWKRSSFGGTSKVHVKEGAVVIDKGDAMNGITYTRGDFPKLDYEVTLEGKKLAGEDFFCTTTFPVGNSFCSLVVGGWGGQVVGLSSINSLDASENLTSQVKEFKSNQWYRVRLRVTGERIQAWIDKEHLIDLATADKKISIRIECAPSKPFGIATWHTAGAVRNIRVRMLSEAEKKAANETKPKEKE